MSDHDYDPAALQGLVDAALGDRRRQVFSHADVTLLEGVHEVLQERLHPAEITAVVDELRDRVIATGPVDVERLRSGQLAAVSNCRACGDQVQPDPRLPHWNTTDPDLVVITQVGLGDLPSNNVLIEAVKDAGFSSDRVMATSLSRCPIRDDADGVTERCVTTHLFREVSTVAPRLTITVGSGPTAVLLGGVERMGDVTGIIHWVGPWPVLPIMTPGYAAHSSARVDDLRAHLQLAHHFLYGTVSGAPHGRDPQP